MNEGMKPPNKPPSNTGGANGRSTRKPPQSSQDASPDISRGVGNRNQSDTAKTGSARSEPTVPNHKISDNAEMSSNTGADNKAKAPDSGGGDDKVNPSQDKDNKESSHNKSSNKNDSQSDTNKSDNKDNKGSSDSKNDPQSKSGASDNSKSNNQNQDNKNAKSVGSGGKEIQENKATKSGEDKPNNATNSDDKDKPKAGADGGGGDSVKDKAKGLSSNATGVDYSDKGLKDQLEHQAADVAMDATPGLNAANSARKALKEANAVKNKAKSKAGLKTGDDAADKLEDATDKVVDGGIKGAKIAAGAGLAGGAAGAALMTAMMFKMLAMVKGMILGAVGKVVGAVVGAFQAVGSFFAGLLGVGAAVGNAIAAGVIATVVGVSSIIGVGAIETANVGKKDDGLSCYPENTSVPQGAGDYRESGESSVIQEENAKKLWSVYSQVGGSKEQTAAVLGNLHMESGIDPTSIETIYDEPFQIGPKKQAAIGHDFLVKYIAPSYGAKYKAIKHVGTGVAQWTNGRNRLLIKYAEDKGVDWFTFDTQIQFMFDGDDVMRQTQLLKFLTSTPGNVEEEAEKFMNGWIGLSTPNPSLSGRKAHAVSYMFMLESAEIDQAYADGILSGVNVGRSQGNNIAGKYQQDDGCGDTVKSHYADKSVDGTGEVPSGLALVPWTRETLPESLKEFAAFPEDVGMAWGNATGWATGIYPGQCVALATSYFMQIYPDWNKGGKPKNRPMGNGHLTAGGWALHYKENTVATPQAGSIFSDSTTSAAGHTGVVQHVFANGDMLIIEQNIPGVSGDNNGQHYSWSWRVIPKDKYTAKNYKFFKPSQAEPKWAD